MPIAKLKGVDIAYEEAGTGFPMIWCHEFGGSKESWAPQVRYFSRRHRVITYNARGYPPSGVPDDWRTYSQEQQVEDLRMLLDHLGIQQAIVGGLSMGGHTALGFGLTHPDMCRALIVAGAGTGSANPEMMREDSERRAAVLEAQGMQAMDGYAKGATRSRYMAKDPQGWKEMYDLFMAHSAKGSANTLRGFQARRPSIYMLEARLRQLPMPVLIMSGDEDEPCLEPSLYIKRTIPRSGLAFLPQADHVINISEPALFNALVAEFLAQVDAGRWDARSNASGDTWIGKTS
ncbi:MAG: alpha/beta hydrolase [SAR202 cluster bacterium]|nr:alpha/beta hydrolase [SAR202 cluster bacterium]